MVCWIWFVNSIMKYIGYWSQAGGFYPLLPPPYTELFRPQPNSRFADLCSKKTQNSDVFRKIWKFKFDASERFSKSKFYR